MTFEEEVEQRLAWIYAFRAYVRRAVEGYHPGHPDRVKKDLAEQEDNWAALFGSDGDVAAKDLPGQMLPGLQEERT